MAAVIGTPLEARWEGEINKNTGGESSHRCVDPVGHGPDPNQCHIKCHFEFGGKGSGVPKNMEREAGLENKVNEIIMENFPNVEKELGNKIQEGNRTPNMVNQKPIFTTYRNQALSS